MEQLREENSNASIWGNDEIISKAATMAGFKDKNRNGSILDEAGKISAGNTINFDKKLSDQKQDGFLKKYLKNRVCDYKKLWDDFLNPLLHCKIKKSS